MNELIRKILSLPEQASTYAHSVDKLHFLVIGVTMVGWAILTVVFFGLLFHYRAKKKNAVTEHFKMPMWLEMVLAGSVLAFFLVTWWIGYRQYIAIQTPPKKALQVYVTGKQWMWKFAYPGGQTSEGTLTVPAGRPVKLLMISRDVIHSFSVPAFRMKQDVIPGRYTSAWFEAQKEGEYQILCAEYCGLYHSRMAGTIRVLSPADYEEWIDGLPRKKQESLVTRGQSLSAEYGCFGCHTTDGKEHLGPTWKGLYQKSVQFVDDRTTEADEAYITESIMDPKAKLVTGFKPIMPSYQNLLDAGETAAIVEYIKSLREKGTKKVPSEEAWPNMRNNERELVQ